MLKYFSRTERYRSGHNEAVLKTVWVQAHVGSNPTLSAIFIKNKTSYHGEVLKLVTRRPC